MMDSRTENKPSREDVMIAMALLEQLVADFEPHTDEDHEHALIAGRVARWFLEPKK